MSVRRVKTEALGRARRWLYGLWVFYRQYTHSPTHAASAAALTIFGLLVFIDPLFVGVAIAAYVCPPILLYVLADDDETARHPTSTGDRTENETAASAGVTTGSVSWQRDTDMDWDFDDGDSDSDSDDGDSDSDDRETGSDRDSDRDGDTDSDGADTDTDSGGIPVDT